MRLIQTVKEKIMKNGLPEGYTRLEYLQSTGVQYIDTGVKGNLSTKIEAKAYSQKATTTTSGYCIAGDFTTSTKAITMPFNFSSGGLYSRFGDKSITSGIQQADGTYTFAIDKNGYYVNGTKIADLNTTTSFTTDGTMMLFGFTGLGRNYLVGKMYYCKIWDNDTLVRDFVPALDPSDKPCMYDLVSKQPFYNLGTGADFSIGKKLTPVEYIANTGSSYINTGYNPNSTTRVETKFKMNESPTSFKWLFLSRAENVAGGGFGFGCVTSGYISSEFNDRQTSTDKLIVDTYYIIDKNRNLCTYNNKTLTNANSTFSVNYPLPIFALNNMGTITSGVFPLANCYYFRIYDNDTLVRDLIPVRDENNVGYMLDLLTNTLYANAGSGSFAIGEDDLFVRNIGKIKFFKQTTRKVPKGFQEVEYLESTGTQYIDTGFTPINDNFQFETVMFSQNTSAYLGYRSVNSGTATGDMRWFFNYNDGRVAIRYGDGTENSTLSFNTQTTHRFYFNGSSLYVDDVNYLTTTKKYATPVYKSFYLFSVNTSGYYSTDIANFVGRIYYTKIWDNGVLVRDFVPYLDASGRPCMWDMVEGKPYYNQGTGEFSYGRKIIPVEYLESTGTQYIDTGIKGKNNIDFDYKVNFTNVTTSSGYGIGGEWESQKSLYLGLIRSNGNFAYHYANTNAPVVVLNSVSANTDYSIQGHMWSGEQYMVINSTKSAVGTITGTFESTQNITLFRVTSSSPIYCYAKIYYLKIWDNNTLVRDYIPAIDENNTPYMFDRVTHSAFLNAGTGNFLYGNPVGQRTETLRVLPIIRHLPLNYLESTGTQYINTGLLSTAQSKVDCIFGFSSMESGVANNVGVFGGRNGQQSTTFTLFKIASGTPQYFRFDFNGQPQVATANQLTWDTASKYRFEYDGTKYTTTNTTTSQSVTASLNPGTTFTTSPICLFAVNTNGTIGQYLSGRIYHYWYTDGTNTIDLVPVLKLPERIPCMYDRVSKTYFYNESTDPFLYG